MKTFAKFNTARPNTEKVLGLNIRDGQACYLPLQQSYVKIRHNLLLNVPELMERT